MPPKSSQNYVPTENHPVQPTSDPVTKTEYVKDIPMSQPTAAPGGNPIATPVAAAATKKDNMLDQILHEVAHAVSRPDDKPPKPQVNKPAVAAKPKAQKPAGSNKPIIEITAAFIVVLVLTAAAVVAFK